MSRVGRFRVRLDDYARIAIGAIVVFTVSSYGFWLRVTSPAEMPIPLSVTGFVAVFSAIIGVFCIGICIGRPVGLRLDVDGMSGYLLPPLEWSQIIEVGLHEVEKYEASEDGVTGSLAQQGDLFLALRLYDAKAWRLRATLFQRTLFIKHGWNSQWDVLLPIRALHVPDPKELVHLASDLHEGRLCV